MNLTIANNKSKMEIFSSIFQLLKNWSNTITIHFKETNVYIQLMDKSQICLAYVQLNSTWFSSYKNENKDRKASMDSHQLSILMGNALKNDILEIVLNDENDDKIQFKCLHNDTNTNTIHMEETKDTKETKDIKKTKETKETKKTKPSVVNVKGSYNTHFELLLMDVEEEEFTIPDVEYDVDIIMESKKFVDILHEIAAFGDTIHIIATENNLFLQTTGDTGTIKIDYPIDNLEEYGISEGVTVSVYYSLGHLLKMCCSTKLSDLVHISLHEEYPMSIAYTALTEDNYSARFFIASKIVDEE